MNVGVLGSGTMGGGIAQLAATQGCVVQLFDISEDALKQCEKKLKKILNRLIEKGRIDEAENYRILSNIIYTTELKDLSESQLIIEAIVENLDIKKKVFSDLEKLVSDNCILATNTSSLSVTSIASACDRSDRFIGIHFFNPAPLMKLVEIIPAMQTSHSTLEETIKIIDNWKKTTVVVKDSPGFIVNKVARPYYGEAAIIAQENGGGQISLRVIDNAMKAAGFRMGPFELMDYIGNDINYKACETVFRSFYNDDRYRPSIVQKRLVEAGYLGRKSERGWYDYGPNAQIIDVLPDFDALEKIQNRIIIMLINEAADTLFKKIATKEDIDLAMTKGVNYPKGLLAWADEIGIQECVDRLDSLYDEYREDRYRCCPLLRRMAKSSETFYKNN